MRLSARAPELSLGSQLGLGSETGCLHLVGRVVSASAVQMALPENDMNEAFCAWWFVIMFGEQIDLRDVV